MNLDIGGFFRKCVRVWHILKKPSKEEFVMVAKVSALGILAVGLLGFIVAQLVRVVQ